MNQLKLWILPEEEMIDAVPLPAPTGDPDRDRILRLEAGRLVALAAQRWLVEWLEENSYRVMLGQDDEGHDNPPWFVLPVGKWNQLRRELGMSGAARLVFTRQQLQELRDKYAPLAERK